MGARACHEMWDMCSGGKMASTGSLPSGMCSSSVEPFFSLNTSIFGAPVPYSAESKLARHLSEIAVCTCAPIESEGAK